MREREGEGEGEGEGLYEEKGGDTERARLGGFASEEHLGPMPVGSKTCPIVLSTVGSSDLNRADPLIGVTSESDGLDVQDFVLIRSYGPKEFERCCFWDSITADAKSESPESVSGNFLRKW